MPTNKERSKIAAKLREHQYSDVRYPTFEGGIIASWLRLKEALGVEGDDPQEDHTMMFGYLADLIELEPSKRSNDERYEIATKLRNLDEQVLDSREYEHRAICAIVGCWSGGEHSDMELKDRLADLIKPN